MPSAKEFMSRARNQEERILQLRRAAVRALDAETSATSKPSASGVRAGDVHRGGESYAMLSAQIDEEIARLGQIRSETLGAVEGIEDNTLAALLIAYYVNDLPWADVAEQLHYSPAYVRKTLHAKALGALDAVLANVMPK